MATSTLLVNLTPVFVVLGAWQVGGGAIVLAGVVLARSGSQRA